MKVQRAGPLAADYAPDWLREYQGHALIVRNVSTAAALLILLCFAVPVNAQAPNEPERPIAASTKWLMGGLVITGGIDTNLTTYVRAKCGDMYREANPVVRPIVDYPAALATAKGTITAFGAYALYRMGQASEGWVRKLALWAGIGLNVLNGFVIHNNYQFYKETVNGCSR